ncbi:MAG: T9SS type A sorting domain-containing protein [Bacteroidales bacterium]
MRTYSKDYITLNNLEVTGWLSTILDGCSHWVIEHCDWGWGNGEHGIRIRRDGSKHSLNGIIRHCTFDSGDRNPVTQSSPRWGSNTKQGLGFYEGVSNWQIHNNYFRAWGHVHVVIESRNGYPCEGNKIYDNYFTNMDGSYGRSVTIETHKNTLSLMNPNNPNEFYNNYTYKQSVQSQILGAYTKVYNNVWNIVKGRGNNPLVSANAISLDGYSSRTGYKQKIYNNVFAFCGQAGIFYPGYDTHEDQRENEVINNIFYKNGRGEDHRVDNQLYIGYFTPVTVLDNIFRNNIFYTDRDANKAINIYKSYIDVSTFNSVSSGSKNLQNHITSGNLAVDPLFIDPENGDFRLKENSPAVGAGLTPLSVKDMAGTEWGDKPNIGPYAIANSKSPEPVQLYTLSLENEGNGIVLSNGKEENSKAIESETTITIEAVPHSGWIFSNWAGDVSGYENPLEIKMTEDKSIKAIFTEETYTLTIIYEGEGEVKIFPEQETYVSGTMINLEAHPDGHWEFQEWVGDLLSTDKHTSIVIEQNMIIKAKFSTLITSSDFINEEERKIQIYPNPAKAFFRISAENSTVKPDRFNILDLSGRTVYQGILMSNISDIQIPGFLNSGIYIIELISKKIPFYTQRLVITK